MHCGNITWGLRKEDCSLEKELCGVLPASVENLWWIFLFSGKQKRSLMVVGVIRVTFQAESAPQSSLSQKSYVCTLHHSVSEIRVFLCIPFFYKNKTFTSHTLSLLCVCFTSHRWNSSTWDLQVNVCTRYSLTDSEGKLLFAWFNNTNNLLSSYSLVSTSTPPLSSPLNPDCSFWSLSRIHLVCV